MKLFYSILIIFSMSIFPLSPAETPVIEGKAVLIEGTARSEGLPGFSENHIPCLFARYKAAEGSFISVWAVTETLVFDPDRWTLQKTVQYPALYFQTTANSQIWVIQRTLVMRTEMKDESKWSFVVSFDKKIPENYCTAFFNIFLERTEFFFTAARRPGDLSFPATLTVTGKQSLPR